MSDYRSPHSGDGIPSCSRRRDLAARLADVSLSLQIMEQRIKSKICHLNPSLTHLTCADCSRNAPGHGREVMRMLLQNLRQEHDSLKQELAAVVAEN